LANLELGLKLHSRYRSTVFLETLLVLLVLVLVVLVLVLLVLVEHLTIPVLGLVPEYYVLIKKTLPLMTLDFFFWKLEENRLCCNNNGI
jgi:hypothetical protein